MAGFVTKSRTDGCLTYWYIIILIIGSSFVIEPRYTNKETQHFNTQTIAVGPIH